MICPDCKHDNIPGADACENCGQDLTALDTPGSRTELEASLTEISVEKLSPKTPVLVPARATVSDALTVMRDRRIGAVLIGTSDEIVGIFSERDVLLRIADRYQEVKSSPITEFMTANPETLELDAPIAFALNKMEVGDFRHLPITRDGLLVGVISLRDVLAFLSAEYPDLIPAASER